MTILWHELRRGRISLLIWTAAIAFMLAVCVMIYPEMSSQMGEMSEMFADMGAFTQAFGMDQLNFGEFIGYFGIECGNVLGLGGAFFAALIGISSLAKEEKEHTAEFLMAHPVSRRKIVMQKLLAVLAQVTVLNIAVIAVSVLSALAIGESADAGAMALLFLAYYLMQLEIAAVTFGISAFLRRGSLGIGLGLAAAMYFLNIISNLMEETEVLKYITPFGYTESADIISDKAISLPYLCTGMAFALIGVTAAFLKYTKKDIV